MDGVATELSASLEDYLEAIYQVMAEHGEARGKDIADRLGVAASSVTNALRGLAKRDLIRHEPYDRITLTDKGRRIARDVVHRHEVLTDFLTNVLAVDEATATDCACKMEHVVGDDIMERLVAYIKYNRHCTNGGAIWVEGKGFICHDAEDTRALCASCTAKGYCRFLGPPEEEDT
ncbi:MAG: metal-dependent transcriptional regulator [Kiritimatiellia bacterium]|jgi:DtxR family Mn-dependent transcriptional regulator|nr:metal-dependent transcriptional regulator [Kiritimatiellia bacterium]MDP6631155.1 metal-dependent transcriptional regulator [Kiritimatiellia bacterium]MDP6809823.1 metal-dependent transcriptional regulator [Kiritimatiellia bacterium]MDP7025067.1 metal-dependent transcriptional regulator [Kiritimatiellia bacterium]